jgi:glycosyltransferase involved in cell wall biosynthesis
MADTPAKPNYSIVIIARNEEQRIARTLTAPGTKAHIDAGGDVLVADTGSEDNTCAVAEALGARTVKLGPVHSHTVDQRLAKKLNKTFVVKPDPKFVKPGDKYFNFAAARNDAHRHAKCDMVLQIDTCDMLEVNNIAELSSLINAGITRFTYWHYLGTGNERQNIARFYDRRIDRWSGISHEALSVYNKPRGYTNPQGEPQEGQTQVWRDIGTDLLQVRYLRNQNKARPYHIGMMLDNLQDPSSPRWYHYLGREFYYHQRWHSALKLLLHQTTMDTAWVPEKSQSWVHAGECYEALGDFTKARLAYFEASFVDPGRREPWIRLARLYRTMEKALPETKQVEKQRLFQAGMSAAKAALVIPCTTALSENIENYEWAPHELLAWGGAWSGRREVAKYHWRMSCHYDAARFAEDAKYYVGVEDVGNSDVDGHALYPKPTPAVPENTDNDEPKAAPESVGTEESKQ